MLRKKRIPSREHIKKFVNKEFGETEYREESRRRTNIIISLGVLFLLLSVLMLFESFWKPLVDAPKIQGQFILESCTIKGLSECNLEIFGDDATFSYDTGENVLIDLHISGCEEYKIESGNTAQLYGCSFSTVSNAVDITVVYKNSVSGLVHEEKARVVKFLEITSLNYLSSQIIEDIFIE